jgi:hypothetical protein
MTQIVTETAGLTQNLNTIFLDQKTGFDLVNDWS